MRATIVFLFFLCIFGTWYVTSIHYLAEIYCIEKRFKDKAIICDSINNTHINDSINWKKPKMDYIHLP